MKLNTPHDFLCHECFKNIYIVGVRNVEVENHSGHTVTALFWKPEIDFYKKSRAWQDF